MNELALFAGAGGGILGGHLLGWRCMCAVECDKYARNVLLARQQDGCLPKFPIWDDVRTFDGKPWRGVVDVVSGGFPCQDISSAGKGAGIEGARSGLWKEMARIVGEVRPHYAFVENSPLLIRRGLTTVLSDLAEMGYDAVWGIVSAADCGASHERKRLWVLASDTNCIRPQRGNRQEPCKKRGRLLAILAACKVFPRCIDDIPKPWICRSGERLPNRVDRTRAIGNAQVPIVAATAWRRLITLMEVI